MTGPPVDRFECASCPNLSGCILSALDNALGKAAREVHLVPFDPGETIFRQGAQALGWHILCQGRAKLGVNTARGKRLLLRVGKPGDLPSGLTSGTYPFSAVSLDRSVAGFIDRDRVRALIQKHPELGREVSRRLAQEQGHLAQRLADLTYTDVRTRLVRALLALGEEHGVEEDKGLRIDLPLSLRDLAEMIGASPQTTSEGLQALARAGLVRVAWSSVLILDPAGLRGPG